MNSRLKRPLRYGIVLGWLGLIIGTSPAGARAAHPPRSIQASGRGPAFAVVYVNEATRARSVILTARDLVPGSARATPGPHGRGSIISVDLSRSGAARFSTFTRKHLHGLIALILNGRVQYRRRIDRATATHQMRVVLNGTRLTDASATAHRINRSIGSR